MPSDNDHRERPTSRPPRRPTSPIIVYRTAEGVWSFTDEPGATAVEARLAEGYRVDGVDGARRIVREPGGPEMTAEQGVRHGILVIPIVML